MGTSGERRVLWQGMAALCAYVLLLNTVNVFSILRDAPGVDPVVPVVLEATSFLAVPPAVLMGWFAFRLAPPDRGPVWRTLLVHVLGALGLSAVHVSLFVLLRKAVFAALGRSYDFGSLASFPYEFRKDLVGYAVGVAAFWALTRLAERKEPAPGAETEAATFDIRDGARLIRVPVSAILAGRSAGNYVEFHLADGRRPMMRISLSALETQLSPHGFVRTHRSWLVNTARVRELRPESSGDYRVSLGPVEAPISRRFPEALARLRAAGPAGAAGAD